jgi:hypothetical protein
MCRATACRMPLRSASRRCWRRASRRKTWMGGCAGFGARRFRAWRSRCCAARGRFSRRRAGERDGIHDLSQDFENTLLASVTRAIKLREFLESHSGHRGDFWRGRGDRRPAGQLRSTFIRPQKPDRRMEAASPPIPFRTNQRPESGGFQTAAPAGNLEQAIFAATGCGIASDAGQHDAIQKIITDGQNLMRKTDNSGCAAGNPRAAHAGSAEAI